MLSKKNNLGFSRMGKDRELKKSLESFWRGKTSVDDLLSIAHEIKRRNWTLQKESGIDFIPSNDFSLYDHMLDMTVMVGAIPERYQGIQDALKRYFAMARGLQEPGIDLQAMEMTKWFDTNYHYIVPELRTKQTFKLDASKILAEIKEARNLGIETKPVIVGPVTFLMLSKMSDGENTGERPLDLIEEILPVYEELLKTLKGENVAWVQIDEPCLVYELGEQEIEAYRRSLDQLIHIQDRPKILLGTYFGALSENMNLALASGADALHLDLVRAPTQLESALTHLDEKTILSLGLIDGRNVWKTDLESALQPVQRAKAKLGAERVWVAPSCSLLHVPVDLEQEKKLDPELKSWLAFGVQKLREVSDLGNGSVPEENKKAIASRKNSTKIINRVVKNRVAGITPNMLTRAFTYATRAKRQERVLNLPTFPTTTIGSFPQTETVRKARADWKAGKITQDQYNEFLKAEIEACVQKQEDIGLDVFVHGEFERTDMVEYFGEKLSGFAFTQNGWVQSYGSRCVKPPIIYGDVERTAPMTVEWSIYSQSLTKKPMKGMLTGPVTILQWSFVRDDQPRSTTCMQIGLALRDEVRDLEAAGIKMIQVDEPAIREGLPLKRSEWKAYLRWAVDAFRLSTCYIRLDTQIHTHMCYSEFSDILDSVVEMDADVISIETSRSRMELLRDFEKFNYPNEVGPGVYDIHSPRVPTTDEMVELLRKASKVIPARRLWVNPDCGLKTRGWKEVQDALVNMVAAVKTLRSEARP